VIILAIDCALGACQVALVRGDAVVSRLSEVMARGQAERIAPMAREAFAEAGLGFAEIDRVVATTGPGSFTGLRVGLAFARGLALALDKPIVGVSTLETLALEQGAQGLRGALIAAAGVIYGALYLDGAAVLAPQRIAPEAVGESFASAAQGRPFPLRGPGVAAYAPALAAATECIAPDVVALARLGAAKDPALAPPHPLYLRAALA
jgi:tRNA threonylcarbamoyladenosine biosynthesis protein TsaB